MKPRPLAGGRRAALRFATCTHPYPGPPQMPSLGEEHAQTQRQRESRTRFYEIVILTFTCGVLTLLVECALFLGHFWITGGQWPSVVP